MSIDVASIDTEIEKRDDHLRSPDFFEVGKFPKITFKSTGIKKAGKNRYRVSGDLTMHGVTKPVTMELWYRGTIVNEKDNRSEEHTSELQSLMRISYAVYCLKKKKKKTKHAN